MKKTDIIALILFCIVFGNIQAAQPDYKDLFVIDTTTAKWQQTTNPGTIISSNEYFGRRAWKAWGFINDPSINKGFLTFGMKGNNTESFIPYVYNVQSLSFNVNYIVVQIHNINNNYTLIDNVNIEVSENEDFTNSKIYHISEMSQDPSFCNYRFEINEDYPFLFYKIKIPCFFSTTGFYEFFINSITFYGFEHNSPEIKLVPESSGKYKIISHFGDLHLIASTYTRNYEFVEDVVYPTASSRYKAATDVENDWRNKVAEEGQDFIIEAPADPNNYTKIRAKSIQIDGTQSDELVTWINYNGITTEISNVQPENESVAEWYNLQGIKVLNPKDGIFIKVVGNKVTKVKL